MIQKDYIPFGKPNFSHEEVKAVTQVLRSGWIGMGPETISFEHELAEFVEAPYVVTVNSCTSALFLSLLSHKIGPGDEVICPSLTWCSTANAAIYLGAKPVFCDVDPKTLNLNHEYVLEKLTRKTKAVIVVHFGGLSVDVENLRSMIGKDVAIIEDAAHALGSRFGNGKPVGSSRNLTCFSFYANKNISTGDGGAISLFNNKLADRLRSLRQNSMPHNAWKRFSNPQTLLLGELTDLGYKMNYTDLQACIGRVQLQREPEFYKNRFEIARHYFNEIDKMGLICQDQILDEQHARHLFVTILPIERLKISRNDFILQLREKNIGASIHYTPLHKMQYYSRVSNFMVLKNTEYLSHRIMTLPISASMDLNDADYVIKTFKKIIENNS